ncbi:MAG: DUF1566 domain-containing protein [Gammaproteobacteria bacterium]|nr:DUF1566 domain-containing protein [Gammaproteobacteria bacterium]
MRCSIGSSWDGSNCTGIPSRLEWKEAKQAITEINKGGGVSGHKDWRLPTVDELKTLINKQCFDPAVDSNSFMDTQPAGYWTSEASTQFPEGATVVHFYHGGDYLTNQIKPWFVRAVRK